MRQENIFVLFLFTLFCGSFSYAQDSLQIIQLLNSESFLHVESKLENDSLDIQYIELSANHLNIDTNFFGHSCSVIDLLKASNSEHLLEMKENEVFIVENEYATQYYKCLEIDSALFFKCAYISYPLRYNDKDSLFIAVKKELDRGVEWNKLKFHLTVCDPSRKVKKVKGSTGWVRHGEFLESFEKAVFDADVGEITYANIPRHDRSYIIFKIDAPQTFAVRKIISVSKNKK